MKYEVFAGKTWQLTKVELEFQLANQKPCPLSCYQAIEHVFRVYIASSKHVEGSKNSKLSRILPIPECLDEAM